MTLKTITTTTTTTITKTGLLVHLLKNTGQKFGKYRTIYRTYPDMVVVVVVLMVMVVMMEEEGFVVRINIVIIPQKH